MFCAKKIKMLSFLERNTFPGNQLAKNILNFRRADLKYSNPILSHSNSIRQKTDDFVRGPGPVNKGAYGCRNFCWARGIALDTLNENEKIDGLDLVFDGIFPIKKLFWWKQQVSVT